MKLKNILPMSVAGTLGLCCISFLTSCDGSSSSSGSGEGLEGVVIEIPDNPDEVNEENVGSDADNTGANEALEASYGAQVYDGINAERTSAGRSVLIRDSQMDALAASHNAFMISVASPGGTIQTGHDNAQSRAEANAARGFRSFGENTAGIRGYSSSVVARTFVDGWVASSGHYVNIIGDYTHTGVAVSVDSRDGTIYATQIFAK
ncbi:MAG: CAP domain-containing protein [Akkermansiaceae bacterium]